MAVLSWNEILQKDKQTQMTGAQGLSPEQLGALRSAELTEGAVNARNIFNQGEINRRNAVAEKQASDMLSANKRAQNFDAAIKLGMMAKEYYPAISEAYASITGAKTAVDNIPGSVDMAEGWNGEGMDEMVGGTEAGSTAIGTVGTVVGNALKWKAIGEAVQGVGRKMEKSNDVYVLNQFGHNVQDATTLPGYTESGLNEGSDIYSSGGRTWRTYDNDSKGTTSMFIEGALPIESGLLGSSMRESITAAGTMNLGKMMDSAGNIMAPWRTGAERLFGQKPGGSDFLNYLTNPVAEIWDDLGW